MLESNYYVRLVCSRVGTVAVILNRVSGYKLTVSMLVANYARFTAHNRSLILVRLDQIIWIALSEIFVHWTKFFVVFCPGGPKSPGHKLT